MLFPGNYPPYVVGNIEASARVAQPPCLVEQHRGTARVYEVAAANRGTLFFGDFLWGSKESYQAPRGDCTWKDETTWCRSVYMGSELYMGSE